MARRLIFSVAILQVWLFTAMAPGADTPVPATMATALPASAPRTPTSPSGVIQASLSARLVDRGVREIVFALRQPGKDQHWYANFGYYCDSEDRLAYGNGGKLCRMDLATRKVTTILEDKDGTIRDPAVDYDSQKILFSYRKGGTPWLHLYEIDPDGSHLRQLTDGPYDDLEPCYLPDGKIAFVSSRCKRWVSCWFTKVATLHRCDGDGSNIRPISANIEHDNTPWPLPDGRLLYQRWEYVDRSQVHYHHLWTSNPDGTATTVYFGNQRAGTVMLDAKPIPNTDKVVAIFSPMHGLPEHNGTIQLVDVQNGPDAWNFARPLLLGANFRDPWAFSEDLFVAAQGKRILLIDGAGRTEEVYRVTTEEAAAGLECHEPRPITPRARELVIPDRTNLQSETGTLVLIDVYKGRNMAGVKRGEIKKLLILEPLPKPVNFSPGMDPITLGGSFNLERVLGTVPVEPDGSASMELPALRPVFFVALDENDMAVKRMQSFTTVQPGEVGACVGCHEQRTETLLPRGHAMAMLRKPSRIEPIADCPEVFDFPRDIQPILDRLCADCHGAEKTASGGPSAGGVVLTGDSDSVYSQAYLTLTQRQLFSDNRNLPKSNLPPRSLGSSASRILKMLDGSHFGVKADPHDFKMLRLWIDVGATYPGTYASLGCNIRGVPLGNEMFDIIERRCMSCHDNPRLPPRAPTRDAKTAQAKAEPEKVAPHRPMRSCVAYSLTQPEKSQMLQSPLGKLAGGLGSCRNEQNDDAIVFTNKEDPDYQKLLAMIVQGKEEGDKQRFYKPGFRPNPGYLREMRHYGILPADHRDDMPIDPYAVDRRYWESLWYRAPSPAPVALQEARSQQP